MLIHFYISGHGFGHASRDVELANAIALRLPEARVVIRTMVPEWLFERAEARLEVQRCETDTGLVQIDSLHFDERETARQAARFYGDFERRVDKEAAVLASTGADLVVGDIPPLAFAAASRAGIPSVAVANFTWDWIYSIYPAFTELAPEVIPTIQRAYATADRALRLPLHGGFEPMREVTRDIPYIARRSRRDPGDTRRLLGIDRKRRLVLVSFGAYGVSLPYETIQRDGRFALLRVDERAPHGLAYPDLVAAADVVVSKPGYGIVSECIANQTALLYTSRGRFIEYDVLVAEMPAHLRCRYISQEDLFAGRWAEAIEALVAAPTPPGTPRVDGADIAAGEIASLLAGVK